MGKIATLSPQLNFVHLVTKGYRVTQISNYYKYRIDYTKEWVMRLCNPRICGYPKAKPTRAYTTIHHQHDIIHNKNDWLKSIESFHGHHLRHAHVATVAGAPFWWAANVDKCKQVGYSA